MNIAVIGAGAAGLMAAARAAMAARQSGIDCRVVVLEKNRKAGVKILMSGGTRCNLTHDCGPEGIMEAFGRGGAFLRQALAALPPIEVVRLFNGLGVATQIESTGKVFPSSNRAVDVRDALLKYAIDAGAEVCLDRAVKSLKRDPQSGGFFLEVNGESLPFDRVIVTVGGKSWPGCGTIGEGYQWMRDFGHTIVPPRPALVPLVGGTPWMHEISGLTLDSVTASVWSIPQDGKKPSKKPLLARRGGFLFTHFGFSGPTAMDVSGIITAAAQPQETRLTLDLLPDLTTDQVVRWVEDQRSGGRRKVSAAIAELLPRRLADAVTETAGATEVSFAELPRAKSDALIQSLKQLTLPVTGTRGFDKAEVTAGGVSLKEVDPRTMQSRIVPGLFIAGEILDLDGWIGGYNFQSAFSTGLLAGTHAVTSEIEVTCVN